MTRITYISDLHIEHAPWDPKGMDGDVRVFAGDICDENGSGLSPIEWIAGLPERTPAVFVAGNHDFYGSNIPTRLAQWRNEVSKYPWIHFLENEAIELEGVHFLGATLWSGLDAETGNVSGDGPHIRQAVQEMITDFHVIWAEDQDPDEAKRVFAAMGRRNALMGGLVRRFGVDEMIRRHKEACVFLERECTPESVVITHFPAHPVSVHPRFAGSPVNPYFTNDMALLRANNAPKAWIQGHTHSPFHKRVLNTDLFCNPRGYPGERTKNGDPPVTGETLVFP